MTKIPLRQLELRNKPIKDWLQYRYHEIEEKSGQAILPPDSEGVIRYQDAHGNTTPYFPDNKDDHWQYDVMRRHFPGYHTPSEMRDDLRVRRYAWEIDTASEYRTFTLWSSNPLILNVPELEPGIEEDEDSLLDILVSAICEDSDVRAQVLAWIDTISPDPRLYRA